MPCLFFLGSVVVEAKTEQPTVTLPCVRQDEQRTIPYYCGSRSIDWYGTDEYGSQVEESLLRDSKKVGDQTIFTFVDGELIIKGMTKRWTGVIACVRGPSIIVCYNGGATNLIPGLFKLMCLLILSVMSAHWMGKF